MKQVIALDVGVGYRRKRQLESYGYNVVVVARESETDDSWINRAFVEGAKFVISPDLDIPKLIETQKYPMVWVNYPNNEPAMHDLLVKYIDDTIKFKLKLFKEITTDTKEVPVKNVSFVDKLKRFWEAK